MAEKRKRPITQAGGLNISDVTKMGKAFIANLKKLSKEDLNKFPTSLLSGIIRIVEPGIGITSLRKERNKEGKVEKTYNSPKQTTGNLARKTGTPTKKSSSAFMAGGMAKKKPTGGLKKLPTAVRNKMGYMNKGGMAKKKVK